MSDDATRFAKELGRRGGLKGGAARAAKLGPERRREIAQLAAAKRWGRIAPEPTTSTPNFDWDEAFTAGWFSHVNETVRLLTAIEDKVVTRAARGKVDITDVVDAIRRAIAVVQDDTQPAEPSRR